MPKTNVLLRYLDDWVEFYVDGKLIYEQEFISRVNLFASFFMEALAHTGIDLEYRIYKIPYEYDEESEEDYAAPLHSMTGENYWSDWDIADKVEFFGGGELVKL